MSARHSHTLQHIPVGTSAWRIVFRLGGALLALAVFSYWGSAGFNTGWTKNRVPLPRVDEVTGVEYTEYEQRLVPGLEFLVIGLGLGFMLVAVTFFPAKPKHIRS